MIERSGKTRERAQNAFRGERGFGILQLIITIAIIGIITVLAVMSVASARQSLRLSGSARLFGSWVEKARMDAIRRRATSTVQFLNNNTYRVTMDFDGRGETSSRDIRFEDGVSLLSTAPPTLTFDWRGRVSACTITFAMQNSKGDQSSVDVTGSGDVTVDSDIEDLPSLSYTNVNRTADVVSDSTINGSTPPATLSTTDCSASTVTGGSGTITGTGASNCSFTSSPAELTIKRNGGSTGSITVTQSGGTAGTITVSAPSNLRVTPANQSIAGSGSASFAVRSINQTRGTFQVVFTSPCTSITILVNVVK